ncbi:MAG: DUF305 domain-containing protein [Ignavibacteriae bacterium]|nr:MAG: DUF305 domain-containing protein [Ignavibacteriota bacterium]
MKRISLLRTEVLMVMLFSALFLFSSCKSESDTDRMRSDRNEGTTDEDKDNTLNNDRTMTGSMTQSMNAAMNNMNETIKNYSITGDSDYDFAMIMMPHHQAAIDMGQAYLNNGQNTALKDMVQKDIEKQKQEIAEIKDWLARQNNYSPGTIDPNYKSRIDKVVADMTGNMDVRVQDNPENTYINTMTSHHQSAIDMAKIEQQYGKINAMKNLSNKIITEQQDGIKKLQDMRTGMMNK